METLKNITYAVLHGICDSLKGFGIAFYIDSHMNRVNENMHETISQSAQSLKSASTTQEERRIGSNASEVPEPVNKNELRVAKQIFKLCALNGGFALMSIIFFEYIFLPSVKCGLMLLYNPNPDDSQRAWGIIRRIMVWLFDLAWVMPLYILSKIVNSLWFQDIANEVFKFRKGRPQLIQSFSKLIADFLFSILVQMLFLMQCMLLKLLPFAYLGYALNIIHLSFLYSLYSFEYKWFNMGWELHKRLSYIEYNWPYFLGFGLPLTLLTSISDSTVISGSIFSILFPLFILGANEAQPVVGACETPVRLFSPVIIVANLFFSYTIGAFLPASPPPNNARQTPARSIDQNRPERRTSRSSSRQSSLRTSNVRLR